MCLNDLEVFQLHMLNIIVLFSNFVLRRENRVPHNVFFAIYFKYNGKLFFNIDIPNFT